MTPTVSVTLLSFRNGVSAELILPRSQTKLWVDTQGQGQSSCEAVYLSPGVTSGHFLVMADGVMTFYRG